jgi:hypothetical protein
MPTNNRFRLNDRQRFQNARRKMIKAQKYKTVEILEGGPFRRFPFQNIQLMTQSQDLGFQ